MSVWGKLIGSALGFAMGGPFGAMLGASLGHAADEGALGRGIRGALPGGATLAGMLGTRETVFAVAAVVLSAKLAKCDGAVKRTEIEAFKAQFRIPQENMREVGELFDRARDTPDGFLPYARKLGEAFADEPGILEDVLAALFRVAGADGPVNRAELAFLSTVHAAFALDVSAWERASSGRPRMGHPAAVPEGPDPYATLGLAPGASDEAVRAAWRQLMREHHPDSLTARGVSAELVRRATGRVAEINAAWDRIKRERGL